MPIDPRISLGVQQLQVQDPLAQYAKVAQIQNYQQANALNAQRAQQQQKENDYQWALRGSMERLRNVMSPDDYLAWHRSNHADPVLGPMLSKMGVSSNEDQIRMELSKPGGLANMIQRSAAGSEKLAEVIGQQANRERFQQAWGGQTGGSVGPEANQSWQPATSTGQVLPPLGAAPTPQTNALAAPQPNADRDRVNRLFAAGFTDEAKALAATLPKPQENLMSVGGNLYNRTTGQWVTPPQDTTAKPGDRYKTVGNFIFDVKEQKFLTPPKAPGADGQKLQYVQTDQGLVAVPKEGATGEAVTAVAVKDAEGKPLSKPLKDVPSPVKRAVAENNRNLRLAKTALSLIQGKDVGKLKGDKEATGYKGYAPEAALQRMDEKGIDTRAAIADLGSMIIHERSGAAVTASEYPRLRPFIPLVTDDPKTVEKKLERFIQVYEEVQKDYNDMYSKDQGYNVGGQSAAAPAAAPIYAVNDATGERLMSTDGGQTWSPAK